MPPDGKHFKLTLTYNGTDFYGWQKQQNKSTIQKITQGALQKIFQEKIQLIASGRTDTGVHALKQVVNFQAVRKRSPAEIKSGLNAILPPAIRVKKVEKARPDFHSRYQAISKTYRYLISSSPSPFLKNLAWYLPLKIDLEQMKQAAGHLTGKHDFASFQAAGRPARSTVRWIKRISFQKEKFTLDPAIEILIIEIEADGFLYKMARNIIGTLVEVGRGKIVPDQVKKILAGKDRRLAGPTAPAHGLYLKQVRY